MARTQRLRRILGRGRAPSDLAASARALLAWTDRAFAFGGGASAGYHVVHGWDAPYPEITGYFLPTLLRWAALADRQALRARAIAAGEWLARTRLPGGAICRKQWTPDNRTPSVFNTGQVIQGWCALHEATGESRWLELARESGDWLVGEQSVEGAWERSAFNAQPHTYYARVAWAMLQLGVHTGDARHLDAARHNIAWVLGRQQPDGWFRLAGFTTGEVPLTHTIAYVLEGLLEGGILMGEQAWIEAAERAALAMRRVYEQRGHLPGRLGAGWQPGAGWRCLTGDAQTALVWARLGAVTGDERWLAAARRMANDLRRTQRLRADWPEVSGAIQGSQPQWGDYDPYRYPSHAAKFMLDLLAELPESHTERRRST